MAGWRGTRGLGLLGPGLLVAATGVGAGDLATAAFSGNALGVAVLWAVLFGAGLKFVLTEGLARWQLASGTTLLEGALRHFGPAVRWTFLVYFLAWSFLVAAALMSAAGAAGHALAPLLGSARSDKLLYGALHGLLGLGLVWWGGYALFEKVMKFCIAFMFVAVCACALQLLPSSGELLRGLFVPSIPDGGGQGVGWTIALMGGVGGTVTILCYGYWIREEGRRSSADLRACRIDLAVGYATTALFGLAMVIIGARVAVAGRGAGLIVALGARLGSELGPLARWAFLLGAWSAIFSSLLGVWQSVPYLFADLCAFGRSGDRGAKITSSRPYKVYLLALATVPMIGLAAGFAALQKAYAIVGALFLPMLCAALLVLCGRSTWVGARHRNRRLTNLVLCAALAFFSWILARNLS